MDQAATPDSAMWTLRSRGPAHVASHACLQAQQRARPRGRLARFFGRAPLHPEAAAAFRSAVAELDVGRLLGGLGDAWRVLHAVPIGEGADIDHLVIGPGGVFTIATRNLARRRLWAEGSTLLVDGDCTQDLRTAALESQLASRALSRTTHEAVTATPIVAVVDAARIRFGQDPPIATVVAATKLVRHLLDRPARQSPEQIAAIGRAAEEWTTWRSLGEGVSTHTDPDAEFQRLRTEVATARTRRLVWAGAAAAGAAGAFLGTALSVLT